MKQIYAHIAHSILATVFCLFSVDGIAQQDGLYSQYMFNGFILNPAYAGSQEVLNTTAMYKSQWAGVEYAPSSFVLSSHAPIGMSKVGLGAIFANDQVGIHRTNQLAIAGSYALQVSLNTTLNFGLQAGLANRKSNYSSLVDELYNPQDPIFYQSDYQTSLPQFGAGLYLYTPKFYLGLSVPNLHIDRHNEEYEIELISSKRHYFITGGYIFNLGKEVKLQPGFLVKSIQEYGSYIDINSTIIFMDVLWLGASYRSTSNLNFIIQMQVTEHIRLGYAYDAPLTRNTSIMAASHEILLSYYFKFGSGDMISPRFF
jgi:type IX secretion system PorP/SprF family membrane protein